MTLDSFERSVFSAREVFGDENVFRRKSSSKTEKRINRALFDIITHFFSKIPSESLSSMKGQIVKMTEELCLTNGSFIKAISSNTNNIKETASRFVIYGSKLQETLKRSVEIPKNLKEHFSKI